MIIENLIRELQSLRLHGMADSVRQQMEAREYAGLHFEEREGQSRRRGVD